MSYEPKTMQCKFQLGQEVYSQSFGPIFKGTIVAAYMGDHWFNNHMLPSNVWGQQIIENKEEYFQQCAFTKKYPNWLAAPVYILALETPVRSMAYTEYLKLKNFVNCDGVMELYKREVILTDKLAHPEADLCSYADIEATFQVEVK